jgi:dipeptidyl aminopeptidase/acylaminoacyl peptidase
LVILLALAATPCLALLAAKQTAPGTDIFLADLDLASSPPTLGAPRNLTSRRGYDNQPHFEPEGGGLLYTSQRDEQTDIFRVDLSSGRHTQITATPESEYSPHVVWPANEDMSVVRVESDGTQRLWAFPRDGTSPRLLLPDIAPVGYHAWNQYGSLILFILGEPPTLQLVDPYTNTVTTVAQDIGRSLQVRRDPDFFSFLHRDGDDWVIRLVKPSNGAVFELVEALPGSQDLAWTPNGRILMATGSQVFVRDPFQDDAWIQAADLSAAGIGSITRLAVSPSGDQIAFVSDDVDS